MTLFHILLKTFIHLTIGLWSSGRASTRWRTTRSNRKARQEWHDIHELTEWH